MRPSRTTRAALALALTASLGLAACGDDDGADVRNVGEEGSGSGSGSGSHSGSGSGSMHGDDHGSGSGSEADAGTETEVSTEVEGGDDAEG